MKSYIVVILLFLNIPLKATINTDIIEGVVVNFKNGNSKEIAKSFAPSVELLIVDQEEVYSKAQAEQILKDFFTKNPPQKTTILHKILTNPNFKHGVFTIHSKNTLYRVSITFTKQLGSNQFLISELRVEKD